MEAKMWDMSNFARCTGISAAMMLGFVLSALPLLQSGVHADTLYATDFEPPTFVPGPLDGQDGWFAAFGSSAGTVSTDLPRPGGIQTVKVQGSLLETVVPGFSAGSYARALNY